MSTLAELTSLLWWLMLLSATGIVLHDIGLAMLTKAKQETRQLRRRTLTKPEDELNIIAKKIKRGLQGPASFRTLQKEIAQTIVQTALSARGLAISKLPESKPELIDDILPDPELNRFVRSYVSESSSGKALVPRGQMLAELERTVRLLEKAERELR